MLRRPQIIWGKVRNSVSSNRVYCLVGLVVASKTAEQEVLGSIAKSDTTFNSVFVSEISQ